MDRYDKKDLIGGGAYGEVWKAEDTLTGTIVALKKTKMKLSSRGLPADIQREIGLVKMLRGSNHIVRLVHEWFTEEDGYEVIYQVYEYVPTDLYKWMQQNGTGPRNLLSKMEVKILVFQLLRGVAHCHRKGVIHGDLKPSNLLLDPVRMCLKLADFGLSRTFELQVEQPANKIGTKCYYAPEVLMGASHYGPAVDMWAVGCTLGELVNKTPLFDHNNESLVLCNIFWLLGTPSEATWPGVTQLPCWPQQWPLVQRQDLLQVFQTLEPDGVELLSKMLEYDPAKRITAEQALEHGYFWDLDKDAMDRLENPDLRGTTVLPSLRAGRAWSWWRWWS